MKSAAKMSKVVLLMPGIFLIMGMTACSLGAKESAATSEAVVEMKTTEGETTKTENLKTGNSETEAVNTETPETNAADDGKTDSTKEEISEGDPIVARVDRYEDNIIVLRDLDDEDIIYYFSTQNAQVIEGDSPIAAGDIVEITYRGVQGDEEHPGEAVKVVAESMMYK